MDEFSIIRKFFATGSAERDDVVLGIGDDAAVLAPSPGANIVSTADMLLAGVHFAEATEPHAIGHKALAVNLSDLAAMGAEPAWATLLLSIPAGDIAWVESFSTGFHQLARLYRLQLIGGDLVRGPLAVGVQATGYIEPGGEMRRSSAQAGDDIYVTGVVGDAAIALKALKGEIFLPDAEYGPAVSRLNYPSPRVELGRLIGEMAHAAIDVSDGLYGDLAHIAAASGVAAHIDVNLVPVSDTYRRHLTHLGWEPAVCGGDDYELCFTTTSGREQCVAAIARRAGVPISKIGRIEPGSGVKLFSDGHETTLHTKGYNHFET